MLHARNRLRAALLAILVAVGLVATASPAMAADTLCSSANNSFDCVAATGYAGQSTWGYPVDSNGQNCTNYAAYRLAQNGASDPGNLGNANNWDTNAAAKGFAVNSVATVGSIAQWEWQHVAYVEVVTDTYIETTDSSYEGNTRRMKYYRGQSGWPNNFIHIKDVAATPTPANLAVELVHFSGSGSGGTDAVKVEMNGTISGGQTTIGAVTPGSGQFGLGHFNSDGILDLYFVSHQGNSSGKTAVFVAAGPSYTSFLATVETPMGQFDSNHGDVIIGDFTGDNKYDVGVLFANNGAQKAAFGVLNAASTFQSWVYLADVPIGGHDGARSDAVAGDFNRDGTVDLGIGFHQGTPNGNVDFFTLSGASSYQSVAGHTLPIGSWQNGDGQLLSGRFGTATDQIGAVYTTNTPSGKPDLFVLNGMNTVIGSWTLQVGIAPAYQRTFIGR